MAEIINKKEKNTFLIPRTGLAVDIDETLSWTVGYWMREMQIKFGNPENMTAEDLAGKYRYTSNVPYWQHPEAREWMENKRRSNETQEALPLIEGADIYINKINKIIPIAAYITVRPESVLSGTKNWLKKHNFPEAAVICRPDEIAHGDGNKWKAEVLKKLYPGIKGIIDDNSGLLDFLGDDYRGRVFLYDHEDNRGFSFAVACKDWAAVYEEIKEYFRRADFK